MSIWDTELDSTALSDDKDHFQNTGSRQYKQKKDPNFFSGMVTGLPRSAAAGFAKVADIVVTPFDRIADRIAYDFADGSADDTQESFTEFRERREASRNNLMMEGIEYLEDSENSGTGGHVVFGVGDYAFRTVFGSMLGGVGGAISVVATSEGNYSYKYLKNKGVDSVTALGVSGVDSAVAGGSVWLPLSFGFKGTGGFLKDSVLSVGSATAISLGGQYASGQILEANDYARQAKKYEITKEGTGIQTALNTLLFLGGRYAKTRLNNSIDAESHDLSVDELEAYQAKIEAALLLNVFEADKALSPVKTTDPIQENNHLITLNVAEQQIRTGQPVNVPKEVKGEPKPPAAFNTTILNRNGQLLANKAEQVGINPSDALTIAHLESGMNFSASAQNLASSANGIFQVIDSSWKRLGGGDRKDLNEQIRVGLLHIKEANAFIAKKLGRQPIGHEQYLGHLLGADGAVRVLKADPNTPLIDVVRNYDAKNANAIVNNNGMKGLTVGQAVAKWRSKWNVVNARYSGTSKAIGMDGSIYETMSEIKSVDDLIASNDSVFGVNPHYPAELQPRDRTRVASQDQIEAMANNLRPELLADSAKISDGSPILGPDNVVESGNGRTMAIRRAYEIGKAENYKTFVEQYAADRGWDISEIKHPVLVRNRLTDTDRTAFSRLANVPDVAQFSHSERARSDVDFLADSSLLKINNDGSINLERSMDYVRSFVDHLPKSERAAVMTKDGKLSQGGKQRIESALVQHAYGDSKLVARLYENLDDESKTVLNALLRAAPQLAQLNDLIQQGGRHQNSIATDLAKAAQKLSDLKVKGQAIDDYLRQEQLIDDGLSPNAREFLRMFDTHHRSAKAIAEQIQTKIDAIEAMGDPRQGTLFGQTAEEQAALKIIMNNPDQDIAVSRVNSKGDIEEISMTVRERLEQLEAEAVVAKEDGIASTAAANCFLGFGE